MSIPEAVRAVIEAPRLAHLVTLNADGSPQVTCVWVGLDGDEIVSAHMGDQLKLRNMRRDPRVALSIETDTLNPMGLPQYLVVHGRARIEEGGAADLLQRLAYSYLGPDVTFPGPDAPAGFVAHIVPERYSGVGPWRGG